MYIILALVNEKTRLQERILAALNYRCLYIEKLKVKFEWIKGQWKK